MDNNFNVSKYDKADRDHMRRLLQKASLLINLIADNRVPLGSPQSAELIDSLAAVIWNENEKQKDDDTLQELKDDRYSLINLFGAVKKEPAFVPLYVQIGDLLHKYGLFDEEVVLLENAISDSSFREADLSDIKNRLSIAVRYRDSDDAAMSESEQITETLRRVLQKKPLDVSQIEVMLKQCNDDRMLYDIACNTDKDPEMKSIREKAALKIKNRDYQYALSSHIYNPARTSMILNLNDSLQDDDLFIARTVLTDPNDMNKGHMLVYCRSEELLMLGWKYVYGEKRFSTERLHNMGSSYPEAYEKMNLKERAETEKEWLMHAAETALEIISEDDAVRDRLSDPGSVNSEPLHLFLSIHHPRKAIRWWHARQLKNPVYIAYVGSWTSDDQIKEALSTKINSTEQITDMIFGDLSGMDLVFGFPKPKDLTIQDRFCFAILKNHPDPTIREHMRNELVRGKVEIPDEYLA